MKVDWSKGELWKFSSHGPGGTVYIFLNIFKRDMSTTPFIPLIFIALSHYWVEFCSRLSIPLVLKAWIFG